MADHTDATGMAHTENGGAGVTEPVEIDHWCGKGEAHAPHGGCNGFGIYPGSGRHPAPRPLPKYEGPRRSSRTGAIRRQCFPPADEQATGATGS